MNWLCRGSARRLLALPLLCVGAPGVASPIEHVLEVGMARGKVWNPWTLQDDAVELRNYRGAGIADGDLVGPTLRVQPGGTLRVRIDNRLPACTTEEIKDEACFNDTNLHTHGLWVSPAGNSDNVLISIPPDRSFQYEYLIPADHPAGTFWYHPHRHGTSLRQVSSGMAGVLIVEGTRRPTAERPGDIDILLRDESGNAFPERVMLFQQINYACFDQAGKLRRTRDEGDDTRPWICSSGEIGRIDGKVDFGNRSNWRQTGRYTSINGKVHPTLMVRTGQFERWRMVHGGIRERVRMQLRRLGPGAPSLHSVPAAEHGAWMDRYCTGEPLPMWEIALDGLTRSEVRTTTMAVLSPGDRVDVLTYFPEPGDYCAIHEPFEPEGTAGQARARAPRRMIANVAAAGASRTILDPALLLHRLMLQAATRALRGREHAQVRQRVLDDLRGGMRLPSFVPHRSISPQEITGHQAASFRVVIDQTNNTAAFLIDEKLYDHQRIDRVLPLGGVEEWIVEAPFGVPNDHQFHIHVNPFQIVSIVDRDGRDVIDPGGPAYDPDYAGLAGQWRDGVALKNGYRVTFRTRYERFIGDFVLHCHILLHGEQGMMQNLRIAVPAADRLPTPDHSHH